MEKHHQHRTVSRVSWGLAVYITSWHWHFMVLKLFVCFVFSVHCERLQSLSNNNCSMDPDKVKYVLV